MTLTKTRFFFLLLVLCTSPFIIYKLFWLSRSIKVNGEMGFVGKSYTGTIIHSYSNIRFKVGNDTIWFNGNDNIFFKEGEVVPVRYQKDNPYDVRIDIFPSIWGDTLVYGGIPVVLLIALFLHPQVIPRGSRIRLSTKKPLLTLQNPVQ